MSRWLLLALVSWPAAALAQFSPGDLAKPHEKLEGISHCTDCHKARQQLSGDTCLACHKELGARIAAGKGFHAQLSPAERSQCQTCHHEHQGKDFHLIDWGAGGEKSFDHKKTGYALRGKHAEIACKQCHEARRMVDEEAKALAQKGFRTFLGLSEKCTSCHADEHRGQVSLQCQTCHDEKNWKHAPGFDHAKTHYPLTGKHQAVKCAQCHERETAPPWPMDFPTPVKADMLRFQPVEHQNCTACHNDPHANRFGQRCSSCHTTDGWKIIHSQAGERAFHDKTRYPLRGQHVNVECAACHGPFGGTPAKFKGIAFSTCMSCHNDAHRGQLKDGPRAAPAACERCHTVDGFSPAKFELEDHKPFLLQGGHAAVPCDSCHKKERVTQPKPAKNARPELFAGITFQLKDDGSRCETCHADVHGGQMKNKPCSACHTTASFFELSFVHDKDSRFPLQGAHAKTACVSCHKTAKIAGAERTQYRGLDMTCGACHADAHYGQFQRQDGGAAECQSCHDSRAFAPAHFDHAKARFALDGKHVKVACNACHTLVQVAGVDVRRYKPLPQRCEQCHVDVHKGAFKGREP